MAYNNLKKSAPKAMVPAEIAKGECPAKPFPLHGYYVANTEYYNIVPNTPDMLTNRDVRLVGIVCAENPFIATGLAGKIKMLDIAVDESVPASQRLLGGRGHAEHSFTDDDQAVLSQYVAEKCRNVAMPIIFDCNGELSSQQFMPDVLGYYEEGRLHLVQLDNCIEVKIEQYSLKLDVFSRNTGILESDVMLGKRALFIGCGSVGSFVAVELAKSGVGEFMLVDMDIFGYHNICRHQCGVLDVGRYKTDAVGDKILQINPYAKVSKFNCPIQDVDVDILRAFCTSDAIIIGGADNREGDLYACRFAMDGGSAFVSIGCWERAFAGEIFYCLPGMPDYSDFLKAIGYEYSGRVTQNRRFYTTEEELEKVSFEPGISADIDFVTIVGVKIALDLLNRDNDKFTQRLLPRLTQYTLVCNTDNPAIGGEDAEIFSYPLQVSTSIVVPFADK